METVSDIMGPILGTNFIEWILNNPQDTLVGKKVLVDEDRIRTISKVGKLAISLEGENAQYTLGGGRSRGAGKWNTSYITLLDADQYARITGLWGRNKRMKEYKAKITAALPDLDLAKLQQIVKIIEG